MCFRVIKLEVKGLDSSCGAEGSFEVVLHGIDCVDERCSNASAKCLFEEKRRFPVPTIEGGVIILTIQSEESASSSRFIYTNEEAREKVKARLINEYGSDFKTVLWCTGAGAGTIKFNKGDVYHLMPE
ncbi:MAG: hypothetical protein L6R28_20380 [Planctomycetes bacterium]|nr:hypothetical protein [Planctomycetota bacterium]